MTAYRVCATTSDTVGLPNLGRAGCQKTNPFKGIAGVIFTTDDFSIDDMEDMALSATFTDGVKAGTVIPMPNLITYTDESVEPTYYESERQKRTITRQGDYRHTYTWNLPFDVHKKLQSLRNAAIRVFIFDEDNNLYGTNTGTAIKGFSTSMVNPLKMNFMAAGADTPSLSGLVIDYNNEQEWNTYGVTIKPSWLVSDLVPMTDVYMEVVGTATASLVKIRVYTNAGYATDGSVAKVGLGGIVQADFALDLTGAASGFTDHADGTYTFAGSTFATGTITLSPPADATTVFDGIIPIASSPLAVTITT